jgi:diguanylate cyclase (GGDEF)-like protein
MKEPQRRSNDSRTGGERRARRERREQEAAGMRFPTWKEQSVQFLTRYLFVVLGVLFFNFSGDFTPRWMSLQAINAAFALYLVVNTACLLHARRHPVSPARYRLAMWVDIALVSFSMLNDPYDIPPSLLVFIMVVLGNGMRYGMRLFGEALTGCFAGAMLVLTLRSAGLTPGVMFLNLFGGIILIYAYILMSRIESSRRQLEQSSTVDGLTGLMNRRALFEAAEGIFRKLGGSGRLTVMFADLDKFKAVNDTHGHARGDEVLKQFSNIVRDSIRDADIAARYGGDEFVLVLTDTPLDLARQVAERIQAGVADWAQANGLDVSVTIGMGEAPTHGDSLATLLERVDQALYRSKLSGSCGGVQCVDLALD